MSAAPPAPIPTAPPVPRRRFVFGLGWCLVGAAAGVLSPAALRAADVEIQGTVYRPLTEVGAALGLKASWTRTGKTMRLQSQWSTLDFTLHERVVTVNGQPVALGWPLALNARGALCLAKRDYEHVLVPLLAPHTLPSPPALKRIVVDAGHGGDDPGTQNTALRLKEKDLALDLAARLAARLRDRGYEVVLTRTSDRKIELENRAPIANRADGDLFVSVHFNAASASVSGAETFILTPPMQTSTSGSAPTSADRAVYPGNAYDYWNTIVGFSVQKALVARTGTDNRGLKRARFVVLKDLKMPGLLVESGFVSNTAEAKRIATAAYREQIALGIAEGIDLYARTLERVRAQQAQARPAANRR